MFAEISGGKGFAYVGESLPLKLELWIRPYRNSEHRVELRDQQMWELLSDQSDWGPFSERIEEYRQSRQAPLGRRVLREDDEGNQREYFRFELNATTYPERPGKIDGDSVRIVLNYPTGLEVRRQRSMFSDSFFDSMFDDSVFWRRSKADVEGYAAHHCDRCG